MFIDDFAVHGNSHDASHQQFSESLTMISPPCMILSASPLAEVRRQVSVAPADWWERGYADSQVRVVHEPLPELSGVAGGGTSLHIAEIDRTSCSSFWANQFRVLLTAAAYVLTQGLCLWRTHYLQRTLAVQQKPPSVFL